MFTNHCDRCGFHTNHKVLSKETYTSDHDDYHHSIDYQIVKCLGCNRISFREDFYDFEAAYPDQDGNWKPDIIVEVYPKSLPIKRRINDIHILPAKIKSIYIESINAYNANCLILTGVGFRAIIEAICIDKEISGRNLERKINSLATKRLITEKESKRLHSIRFIGNDSVHEMKEPTIDSLKIVLDIIEHLLNNLYIIDYKSRNHLETVIDLYKDFIKILNKNITNYKGDSEVPLAKILSKDVRRLNGKLSDFESELIEEIENKNYELLSIGKFDRFGNSGSEIQHFIIEREQ